LHISKIKKNKTDTLFFTGFIIVARVNLIQI